MNTGLNAISRNPGATWVIPTENEWYKAAYYQPAAQGGDSDSYWAYPMRTNSVPYSDQPPGATPDNSRVGNFFSNDGTANGYNDGYAVSGSIILSTSGKQRIAQQCLDANTIKLCSVAQTSALIKPVAASKKVQGSGTAVANICVTNRRW